MGSDNRRLSFRSLRNYLLDPTLANLLLLFSLLTGWFPSWQLEGKMRGLEVRTEFPDPVAQHFFSLIILGDMEAAFAEAPQVPGGINAVGKNGLTPLMAAARYQDLPTVKALLKAGANPNGAPCRVPLNSMSGSEVWEWPRSLVIASALIDAGADPNGLPGCQPPLVSAAIVGNRKATELLLKAGAKIDQPDTDGETAATTAMLMGEGRLVLYLLDHGASLWSASKFGITIAGEVNSDGRVRPRERAINGEIVARLKAAHYPWPPPSRAEVEKLMKAGKWPPKEAQGQ